MLFSKEQLKMFKDERTYTAVGFENGTDDGAAYASDESVLADCVNMEYGDGLLKTRNGFKAKADSVVGCGEGYDTVYLPFTVTETVYYRNSESFNLAYFCMGDDTEAYLKFYLVDAKGNISPAGQIYIHRVDSETFCLPERVFFTVADRITGSGVFAYMARNASTYTVCDVYEANAAFTQWTNVNDRIYVPTVKIYGRGERYDQAKSYEDLDYPAPERLEELNLLSGKYRCYFTSDGLSAYFRLPYGNLDPYVLVSCRVYSSPDEYTEWTIQSGTNNNTQTVGDDSVTLYVDRTLGVLHFYNLPQNRDYCVPLMPRCKLNNIMVLATTTNDVANESIVSSKGAVMLNNRLYFYGNSRRINCVYCAKMTNPLYVPQSSKLYLGAGTTPVTALKVQNGKLIAFKSGETYRIITSFDDGVIQKEAELPESTVYVRGDTMTAQTIDNRIGCVSDSTVCKCGSRLVWLGGDGSVYALATTTYGNTTNIYRVSTPVKKRLKAALADADGVFAAVKDGKYMLFVGEKIFVMDFKVREFGFSRAYYAADDKIKSPAWFVWQSPEGAAYYAAAQTGFDALILSSFDDGLSFYISTVSGEQDSVLTRGKQTVEEISAPVCSGFTTKKLELGEVNRLKSINSLLINGGCEGKFTLTATEGRKKRSFFAEFKEGGDCLRIYAVMPLLNDVKLEVSSKEPFRIRSIVLSYRLLGKKG